MRMLCAVALAASAAALEVFTGNYPGNGRQDHFQFGQEMGEQFADQIVARIRADTQLQEHILPYVKGDGKTLYSQLLAVHSARYPLYVAELEGIAFGAKLPFETIFAMNLEQELQLLTPSLRGNLSVDHCSDYIVYSEKAHVIAHNEDSGMESVNRTFLARVRFGSHAFVAYVYAGDLATGAFGWVPGNFAFTLNLVPPATADMAHRGVGRGFVSRALLDAADYAAGLALVQNTPMIGGHNYQIMNLRGSQISNTEVYHSGGYATTQVVEPMALFHANNYIHLNVPQAYDAGSEARLIRAGQLPVPTNVSQALNVLGDQFNASYPVFHDQKALENGDKTGLWTLATVVLDQDAQTYTIYNGNPLNGDVALAGSLAHL